VSGDPAARPGAPGRVAGPPVVRPDRSAYRTGRAAAGDAASAASESHPLRLRPGHPGRASSSQSVL